LLCRRLPPWKTYYDTRNKLLIARQYHGFRLWTATLPGILVRLVAALLNESDPRGHLSAVAAGVVDGLRGRKGSRHTRWGLR
jgi:rhamnopyranosyl-N-acetylglucosaminyl-diphospho-decaprenol beta-1,3/1,4-galactofuranosyltransferase